MPKPYPKDHPLRPLLESVAHVLDVARGEGTGGSRRRIAQLTGVSERYLADLEACAANPSLGTLQALADGLKTTVPKLLLADARLTPRLAKLLADRSDAELDLLADLIAARDAQVRQGWRRVALVGLRGAGKTTVGRLVARQLGWTLVELDDVVSSEAGLPLAQIFEVHGEAAYRRYERQALATVLARPAHLVVATGGGIVGDAETLSMLLAGARTVWLKARPDEYLGRVLKQGDHRPVEHRPQALAELEALLERRTPAYAKAELTVETSGAPPAEVAARIVRWLEKAAPVRR